MKCPRTFQIEITEDNQIKLAGAGCIKGDCGVYDDRFQQCVAITNTEQLLRIADALKAIEKKMPHVDQFTG